MTMHWKLTREFKSALHAAFGQFPPLIVGAAISTGITLLTSGDSIGVDAVSYFGALSLILAIIAIYPRASPFIDMLVQALIAMGFGTQMFMSVTTLLFRYDIASYRKNITLDSFRDNVMYGPSIWLVLLPISYLALIVLYELGKEYRRNKSREVVS